MNSSTLPSFWEAYADLDDDVKRGARKAYRLWAENPFHPSLRFKCVNHAEGIWSVRVTLGYRAIGVLDAGTLTWFWIGDHDEYERFFG
ncbi:MAG: hypothetical protein HZB55_03785 [Deltaproteobacteria bacterium]|nr:hypothetical protein [Deltaproteobacteria bacterium]